MAENTRTENNNGTEERINATQIAPLLVAFFTMGFVDFVGTALNYVKGDLGLNDVMSNLFSSMVFIWFFVLSVPAGLLMNRIGRRSTVLLSIAITAFSAVPPLIVGFAGLDGGFEYALMVISFALLGIGNTFMQVSTNPLLANLVSGDRYSSTISAGQFVKAIASFSSPLIAQWLASATGKWWLTYIWFLVISIIAYILLQFDQIKEAAPDAGHSTFAQCLALLKDKIILLCFFGIVCHVGLDAGINAEAPRLLVEKLHVATEAASYTTSIYFAFRTIGFAVGIWALQKFTNKFALRACATSIVLSVVFLTIYSAMPSPNSWILYIGLAFLGFGNSNLFSLMFSIAQLHMPTHENEVSGLMIMGLIGGAVIPLLMGFASDGMNAQLGAVIVLIIPAIYVAILSIFESNLESNPVLE